MQRIMKHIGTRAFGSKASAALNSLKGKTVCVTGGGGGIGQDIATTLDKYGAKLVLVGRNEANLKAVQGTLNNARYVVADLAKPEDCTRLADAVSDADCLVNNAGVAFVTPLMEQTVDDWDTTMDINARSVFLLSQAMAKHWIAQGKAGNICNISSQASLAPLPGHLTYCASKAAVDMVTRMMAMELGPHNIRVNSVNPTVVLTDMGKANWSDPAKAGPMLSSIPLGRFADPEEVSEAVAWMLCDASGMINGHNLPIDGGFCGTSMHLMPKN